VARHPGIVVRALSWNLFHGRDYPPDPALLSWRSRLLRTSEANATHVQLNRSLREEFCHLLAGWEWQLALLQEVPPRWLRQLARASQADGASALTSRNQLSFLRSLLASWSPDLIASNEGGSNQLLVRPPGRVVEVRRLTLTRLPERRRMLWARVELPAARLAVANLHASQRHSQAAAEIRLAAERALEWAEGDPLILGGDFNVSPRERGDVFAWLHERGLSGATEPDAIDHLLARGLAAREPARRLPPEARELTFDGRRLRLSDHAPVVGAFALPENAGSEILRSWK
jgi:endonuclease/exonuclease/phosphatase family metal-dependent hydrolase